jgi:hypothetical protein
MIIFDDDLMGGRGRAVSWAVGGTMLLAALYYLAAALSYLGHYTLV